MIKSLAHACLFSRDLAITENFYCGILELKIAFRFKKSDGTLFGFYLKVAEAQFIEVFQRQEVAEGVQKIGHICLETADLPAMRKTLIDRGIVVTEPKLGADQSWQMWFKDPDGTDIEIHQYTPQSTQFTGADCVVDW